MLVKYYFSAVIYGCEICLSKPFQALDSSKQYLEVPLLSQI